MSNCLICGCELNKVRWTEIQKYETVRVSKIPFGWMSLSPDETDPNLVEIFNIPLLKEKTGVAVCGSCGAKCNLVMTYGDSGEAIVTSCEI